MSFGKKIKELRIKECLTQEQLAEKVSVSRVTISKWETDRGYPSIDSLKDLSEVFDVPVDSLLSSDEIVRIAEKDIVEKKQEQKAVFIGLSCFLSILLLILPVFRSITDGVISSKSLFVVNVVSSKTVFVYVCGALLPVLSGISVLILKNMKFNTKIIICSASTLISALLFAITLQPYPCVVSLFILAIILILSFCY